MTSRGLTGAGTTLTFDALGRVATLSHAIGTFNYAYVGYTERLQSLAYPNGQTSSYSYLGNTADRRLQTIHHQTSGGATLSKFDYTYDTVGNIRTWRQERSGQSPFVYDFAYDSADQLVAAVKKSTDPTPTILSRQAWGYDAAGNRTVEQDNDAVMSGAHDVQNRLTSRAPGGAIVFAGTLSEPATVTIASRAASVDATNAFRGTAAVAPGTSIVAVSATDPSGNTTTTEYDVDTAGSTTTYTYDANGNLTGDGTKTYSWNARNELVRVQQGGADIATFVYDGFGRRVEKTAGGVTRIYVYDEEDIVEERAGADIVRYVHGPGIDDVLARTTNGANVIHYLTDHLGSVVQETDAAAQVTLTREYDSWGNLTQGAASSGYAFTGREWDSEITLMYYRSRYRSGSTGRFISEDGIGLAGGINLYNYAYNNALIWTDPTGHAVINNSGGTIWVKPERGKGAVPVRPGERYDQPHDGLAVPEHRPGEVFKSTDGIDVTIGRDGGVTTSGGSPLVLLCHLRSSTSLSFSIHFR